MRATSARSYSAFGLTVRSDLDLPELPRQDGSAGERADVAITVGEIDRPELTECDDGTVEYAGPDEYYLTYEVVDVAVRDGREIVVAPKGDVPNEILRHVVLGPAFNHLLHQRGHFVLHASVVDVDGSAVAFLGESGQGKTTTAMAFLLEGYRVLSDDVATIAFGDDGPAVRSGYPAIKLDPAVVDRFDVPVGEPREISDARERHFYPLPYEQPSEPVRLERSYVLEDAERFEIADFRPEMRMMKLIENTYTAGLLSDDATAVSNFGQCAELAAAIDVKHLRRPRDLEELPRLVERVIEDLEDTW
ncbi:MAG: hypothetical protein ACQET5_07105 [Halobacteriota archaeon]|uniref:hypothetical protein n=1 Tax=Natronomonas sp. TaxID=2184060 RepID=UPI003974CE8B